MHNILPCYFPTTILFVDDNKNFLKSTKLNLKSNYNSFVFLDDVKQTIDYINNTYKPAPYPKRYINYMDGEGYAHHAIDINLYELPNEVYNDKRFEQISCVVVDYDMPGMDGLEFCKQINDKTFRRYCSQVLQMKN